MPRSQSVREYRNVTVGDLGTRLDGVDPSFFRSNSELPDQWEILFDDISLCKNIGEGASGRVYSGELLRQMDVTKGGKKSTR